jgi:hypothetical protein
VSADSPIRGPQELSGKTVAYSNNGSSNHAGVLALQKHYKTDFRLVPTGKCRRDHDRDHERTGVPFGVAELGQNPADHEILGRTGLRQADHPRHHRQRR